MGEETKGGGKFKYSGNKLERCRSPVSALRSVERLQQADTGEFIVGSPRSVWYEQNRGSRRILPNRVVELL